jgi:lipoprotein NlpD
MKRSVLNIICTVALAVALTACAGRTLDWDPNDYTVRSGDTLYSIAWRYEIDPDDLARWNSLRDTSLIRPGQRLHTRAPRDAYGRPIVAASTQSSSAATANTANNTVVVDASDAATTTTASGDIVVRPGDTLYRLAKKHRIDAKQLARANNLKHPYRIYPGQRLQREARGTTRIASSAPRSKPRATKPVAKNPRVDRWQWPVRGKVLSRFNSRRTDARGIDIAGREGVAIRAAAAGKVVYSGNGLISYGNLVIIKHNNSYLSAYAHNRKLLVSEGEQVKAGQSIAELGKTGTDKPKLHFEIRKHGKPVDPMRYLPAS